MLFKHYHVDPILVGTKTQSRRLWKRPRVKVGGVYPIQTRLFARNSEAKGWIRVTELRKERLSTISMEDAKEEGGYSPMEFFEVWDGINKGKRGQDPIVTVVVFELARGPKA
jgi:hypothetical protein